MSKQEIIAIDFDGVIHDHLHPLEDKKMGEPFPGAKKSIKLLKMMQGYKIVIFSVRAYGPEGSKVIEDWMKFYGIPFDEITNMKPNAKFYIDDRAVRHENWEKTFEFIKMYGINKR